MYTDRSTYYHGNLINSPSRMMIGLIDEEVIILYKLIFNRTVRSCSHLSQSVSQSSTVAQSSLCFVVCVVVSFVVYSYH